MSASRHDDEGTVLVLVLGLTAVLLVLVAVVVDVSTAVLARRALASEADGAAVTAAQSLDTAAFYTLGASQGVPLSEGAVAATVRQYAADRAQPGLVMSGRVDGTYTAVVTATREVRLPFGTWVGIGSVEVTAEARARSPLLG